MKNRFYLALGLLLVSGSLAIGQSASPMTLGQSPTPGESEPLANGNPPLSFQDNSNRTGALWLSADYLLWWVRRVPTGGPLVTTGSLNDFIPGALGQPNTRVLFGDQPIGYNPLSGMRIGAGIELNSLLSLEGNYFFLGRQSVRYSASSDPTGNPLIGRPIFNNQSGLHDDFATSNPGAWAGRTDIDSSTALQGFELNLSAHLLYYQTSKLDLLVGFRTLNLSEDITIRDSVTPLAPNILSFLGGPTDPPSMIQDLDRFRTGNNFYGGQLGLHWQASRGPLRLDLTGKIALGANQQLVTIDGATTMITPGAAAITAPGGLLAQTTNMGSHYRSAFSAVPELGVNLSWQVTPRLRAIAGYTFLYWSNVVRPGSQIDHNINPTLPPGDQDFGNGLGQNRPAFNFHSTDFWAQGINLGLEFRF